MPYITFTEYQNTPGRQYRDVCTNLSTGAYVCEVDEVLDGETEISENEYTRNKQFADAWYENHPIPIPEVILPPPTFEELVMLASTFAELKALMVRP